MILVIHAHPYPRSSRATAALLGAVRGMPTLEVRSLYDLYPDFDVDVNAERAALERAQLVVWMHPIYWYTVPALLKQWFEVVLAKGWAYGEGGTALQGKECLWAATTGADEAAYTEQGKHAHAFEAFTPVVRQTARFCGMRWLEPFVLHGGHVVSEAQLNAAAQRLRGRLTHWAAQHKGG
jgi:glutathione-regulated potassium-efflux system ancillary protein KefF